MALTAEELVRSVSALATLPTVYERLRSVIADPVSSARDVGDVVIEDPALTARILRIVNSAFYGFPGRIDTVSRAIAILGFKQLSDLALATSVIQSFDNIPQDIVTMDSFWRHSLGVGVCARVLAGRRREDNVERFFVAGLLHDLGLLIIYVQCPSQARQIQKLLDGSGLSLQDAEKQVLGFDHADVGHALLKQWHLPESLQEAVHHHHEPLRAKHFPIEAALVHLADSLVRHFELGCGGELQAPPIPPTLWESLGLKEQDLPEIRTEVEDRFQDMVKIMLGAA